MSKLIDEPWSNFYRDHARAVTLIQNKAKGRPFGRKASDTTIEARRVEMRRDSRSNMCPVCFLARPTGGACGCDE